MTTFVSADWVEEHIGRPGYLLVDPRSAMRYLMGHLRGAVSVPLKKLQDEQGRLRPPEELADAFAAAGLGDGVTPIMYDGSDGRNAAMHAWILEYLGRDDIHIMDLLCLCLFTLFDELYITNSLVRKPCSFVNQIQAKIFSMLFRHTKKKNKENSFLNLAWYSFTSLVTNYATCMTTLLLLHTKIRKIIFTNTLTNRSYSISRRSRKNNYVNITFS